MLLILAATLAWADAVPPEPEGCPRGSVGVSSHAGTWCEPASCDTCEQGRCAPIGQCIEETEVACGGRMPDTAEPCTFTKREVLGTCRSQSDCARGTCVTAERCVRRGCGCAAVPGVAAASGGLVLLLAAIGRRRR